ncbi:MAG: S8 family serine peptidase [Phycisphaerae bacterium]|nr:S8 family serine peptidase [Phycisphaerae bacterium]
MKTKRDTRARVPRGSGVAGLVLGFLLAGLAQAAAQDATSYFYDANGRQAIAASADEVLVCVDPAVAPAKSGRPAFLPARVVPDRLPPAATALEDRMEQRALYVARGVDITQTRQTTGVKWALPVLYRVGSDVPIYQTDRIIVRFRPELSAGTIRKLADACGCDAQACERGAGRYILTVRDPHTLSPVAVANTLHERRDITLYAHPDFFLPKVAYSPPTINDPYYLSHQWHLDGDIAKGAAANSDINVETAWDTDNGAAAQGIPSVRVAIQDECVEKWHPDLLPNWATGRDYDVIPYDDDPSPDAGQRHGTSCAGVAVAAGNTIGVRGAAPSCGLIGVKFFGATIAETAESFYFCVDPNDDGDHSDGASIMSNSWGYADGTLLPTDVVAAINYAATSGRNGRGALVLFAAANNDHTVNGVSAIAQLDTVMAIGGTNSNATHTEFSDVGPEVAIATPTNDRGDDGVRFPWIDITTTDNTGSSGYNGLPDLDYTNSFGGTSSATPLAAGILALIISQDPNMTGAQARAILQHTAVRLDEPYGRFDGITGHSHRFGFGRADAGAAVSAAHAGIRWPDRIKSLSAVAAGGNNINLTWAAPSNDYASSLLVRSLTPFAWMPTDGQIYNVSDEVAPGVVVIYTGAVASYTDANAPTGGYFYAVYPRSSANRYGFGTKTHLIRDALLLFSDNCEGPDPGWEHGGAGDKWQRGVPTSANSIFGQSVVGSGPLAGIDGVRAINGDNCWGTGLATTYGAYSDAWLQTPLINLGGVTAPVFLEYYDWCLLETYYDTCVVEVVDVNNQVIGTIDGDTGGDYDWTRRVHDLAPFAGQAFKVRFRLTSDGYLQRDGWFLDEIRIMVAGNVPLPPVANGLYAETPANTAKAIQFDASDPNPGDVISYVILSLPAHGTLSDPAGGTISSVPYTLLSNGDYVIFTPTPGYEGPDGFTYHATDGGLDSNTANVTLSIGTPVVAYSFPLNSNPGWLTEGDWAFGHPQGQAGDPATAYTGLNVYGYNLAGAYTNSLPPQHLTTLPMNCTGLSRVTLDFARWLGVESATWDSASIEVTTDGITWQTVWNHSGDTLEETTWSLQSYGVGTIADDQPFVQFRWTMGPTDSADTYCGWNIDDIQVLAIGTPQANQPPLARAIAASTAVDTPVAITLLGSDSDLDPITYTIVSLPTNGQLSEPGAGLITAVPYTVTGNLVQYAPGLGFAGDDSFEYQVYDGELWSNVATVTIDVIEAAQFPFTEDFEGGPPLEAYWRTDSTGTGRIQVTSQNGPIGDYHLTMDSSYDGNFSRNEVTLAIDLEGHSYVRLEFDWKDFGDEADPLPDSWVGSVDGDGVAISQDGTTWYRIANLFDPTRGVDELPAERGTTYVTQVIDLDQAIATAGISYSNTFRIRFQQSDDYPIDSDGIALDNIKLIQGTTDPLISTASLPDGHIDVPYGPLALDAIGGDAPLVWTVLDTYGEEPLGLNQFAEVGVAQGWQGGNVVWDYTLPFAFPFYDGAYTDVKIASDGWINFGAYVGATYTNSELLLSYNKRIAVLWDNLRTDYGGDIYIDESVAGQVTIRWVAVTHTGLYPCNFAATLYDDGRVRLHYGAGNTGLTPTVGVSLGDLANYTLSAYDAATTLTGVDSVEFDLSRLPAGVILTTGGILSGTPTESGRFKPIIQLEDVSQRTDTKMIPLVIHPYTFGDYDLDGDVDIDDFFAFESCMDEWPPAGECLDAFDDNTDGVIDISDFARFQREFTGTGP